jgi:hypothetical protein
MNNEWYKQGKEDYFYSLHKIGNYLLLFQYISLEIKVGAKRHSIGTLSELLFPRTSLSLFFLSLPLSISI